MNKKGKFFLITTILICVASIQISLNGFHDNKLTSSSWFTLLGGLFISIVIFPINKKDENSYYAMGNLVIIVTIIVCYILPQLIRYI